MTRLLAFVIALTTILTTPLAALAQSVPTQPGYVLVPLSALGTGFGMPTTGYAPTPAAVTISATSSAVRVTDDIAFTGESIRVTVALRDATNRPAAGRGVSVVSSRGGDTVRALSSTTNANGEATFEVVGRSEGVSTITAIDQLSGTTLTERPRIVWLQTRRGAGGDEANLLKSQVLAQTAPTASTSAVAYSQQIQLTFDTASTSVGTPVSVTAAIVDTAGAPVTTFSGTIAFSSPTDPTAIVPEMHTFDINEQGAHTFYNAVTFFTPGAHRLAATIGDGLTADSEATITVSGAGSSADTPTIDSPLAGSITSGVVTLRGTATPHVNLAILIDDQIVAVSESSSDGSYITDIELTEGVHDIAVAILDATNTPTATSTTTTITVDVTAPTLVDISAEPNTGELTIGETITFTIESEPGLPSVELDVGDTTVPLDEMSPGSYVGSYTGQVVGDYVISIRLTDEAGNTTTAADQGVLSVVEESVEPIADVTTVSGNASVTLNWAPASEATLDHYRIRYGTFPTELDGVYETTGASSTATITGLNNDTQYYFSIEAVDATGSVLTTSEQLTAGTPRSDLQLTAMTCQTGVRLAWQPQADPHITRYVVAYGLSSGSYAELESVIIGTEHEVKNLMSGTPYYFTIRGLDASDQIIFAPEEEVSATPSGVSCQSAAPLVEYPITLSVQKDAEGQTYLSWTAVPEAMAYRVYVGSAPNVFDVGQATVSVPYFRPAGLPEGVEYYFAVRAIREGGHEAASFSNIVQTEVGPAEALALALGVSLIGGYLVWRRKHVISVA